MAQNMVRLSAPGSIARPCCKGLVGDSRTCATQGRWGAEEHTASSGSSGIKLPHPHLLCYHVLPLFQPRAAAHQEPRTVCATGLDMNTHARMRVHASCLIFPKCKIGRLYSMQFQIPEPLLPCRALKPRGSLSSLRTPRGQGLSCIHSSSCPSPTAQALTVSYTENTPSRGLLGCTATSCSPRPSLSAIPRPGKGFPSPHFWGPVT